MLRVFYLISNDYFKVHCLDKNDKRFESWYCVVLNNNNNWAGSGRVRKLTILRAPGHLNYYAYGIA